MIIRTLQQSDYQKGFLETLVNLSVVGEINEGQFNDIFDVISPAAHLSPYHIFVAEVDGQVVGAATLFVEQKFIHQCGKVAHLEDVVTRKGFEGRGIGRALVNAVIVEAKRRGCYKIILDCSEKNAPFYEKLGFKKHEIEMRRDL